jgi:hypothetical protein
MRWRMCAAGVWRFYEMHGLGASSYPCCGASWIGKIDCKKSALVCYALKESTLVDIQNHFRIIEMA